jgi:hypothetical protein
MSADRETNHDMTHSSHRDIALLLADAADEVEIGIAPYQAVVRGGRRRKARRWAMAAAAALVIAGSTGSLALAGALDGGDKGRAGPVATQPTTVEERHLYEAQRTTLAMGHDQGRDWAVGVDVWAVPRDELEAQAQLDAMAEYGERPAGVITAKDLVGKGWVFVRLSVGEDVSTVVQGPVEKGDALSGTDLQAYSMPLAAGDSDKAGASQRLVIGKVAPSARRVTCTWDDGTTTTADRGPQDADFNSDDPQRIRPVDGSQPNWFVCLAPEGVAYKSAEVAA